MSAPVIIDPAELRLQRWRGRGYEVSTAGAWQISAGEVSFYLYRLSCTPAQWRVAGMSWAAGDSFWMPWFYKHGNGPIDLSSPPENREPEIRQMMLWAHETSITELTFSTRRELIQTVCDALNRWPLRLR